MTMMSRLASIAIIAIIAVAGLIAYRVSEPQQLVTEADNRDLLVGMATGQAVELTAIAPTATAYKTMTPTRTPKPATETPRPTYGPVASPGRYVVPAYTPTMPAALTVEPDTLPPCDAVTPKAYADQLCEVTTS